MAANFSLPSSSAGPFNCGIALSAGNASRTVIGISGALQAAEGGELLITQVWSPPANNAAKHAVG